MYLCTQGDFGLFVQGKLGDDGFIWSPVSEDNFWVYSGKPYGVDVHKWSGGNTGWTYSQVHSWLPDEFFMEVDNESK